MKQGTVKFSKEFITPIGLKEWVTLEWEVGVPFDSQKAMETFTSVKEFVCNYQSSTPGFPDNSTPPPYGPPTELPVINKAEERVGILIENATSIKELMSYKDDISSPYLSDLFANKLSQLPIK